MTVLQAARKVGIHRLPRTLGFGVFPLAVLVAACFIALGQHQTLTAVAAGPTAVCGTLTSATWNATGSPYQICASGGATVPFGATITLDGSGGPVQVQAVSSGGLLAQGGTIVTTGTSASNNFTFAGPTTTPGSWSGLSFQSDGTNRSSGTLSYVSISYAQYGVVGGSGATAGVALTNVSIDHSANDGVNFSNNTPLTISSSTISNSGGQRHLAERWQPGG